MAILAEMVKRVNENIAKVRLEPLAVALDPGGAVKPKAVAQRKKA